MSASELRTAGTNTLTGRLDRLTGRLRQQTMSASELRTAGTNTLTGRLNTLSGRLDTLTGRLR